MASQRIGPAALVPSVHAARPAGGHPAPASPRRFPWPLDLTPWSLRVYVALICGGAAVALAIATDLRARAQACSPSGSGTEACDLSHGWLRSATALVLFLLLAFVGAWLGSRRRARRGAREKPPAVTMESAAPGSAAHDPVMLAACWGDVGASRRPEPLALHRANEVWSARLAPPERPRRRAPSVCLDCLVLVEEPAELDRCPNCGGPMALTRRVTRPADGPLARAGDGPALV